MEDIILKELTHEPLTPEERLQFDRWLSKSAANRRLFHQLRLSMSSPSEIARQHLKAEVWEDIQQRINRPGAISNDINNNKSRTLPWWFKVAAMFIIGCGFTFILYTWHEQSASEVVNLKLIEKVSMPGQKVTISLPDGTIAKLNADSRLIVPETFSANVREVTLYGEAFFDVHRDEHKPFIIKTKDVEVKVLGTSFNVKSYPDDSESTVAVASGKVSVSNGVEHKSLLAGDKISYKKIDGLGNVEKVGLEKEFGWRENILLFESNSLEEVLKELSRWYGVEFQVLSPKIDMHKKFSGKYHNPTLKVVLEGLSYVYQMEYEIDTNNKKVILR